MAYASDMWNCNLKEFLDAEEGPNIVARERTSYLTTEDSDWSVYELIFRPPAGILNSAVPLIQKTELILSFDRADSSLALIAKEANLTNPLQGKVLELENVSLSARYYTSPSLRNFFSTIENKELKYSYDECSVYCKNLPRETKTIIIPNIIGMDFKFFMETTFHFPLILTIPHVGGNTPSYIFAGIIKSAALSGDTELSSTCFRRHGVTEFDLTLGLR